MNHATESQQRATASAIARIHHITAAELERYLADPKAKHRKRMEARLAEVRAILARSAG